jgi:hypothetical protein
MLALAFADRPTGLSQQMDKKALKEKRPKSGKLLVNLLPKNHPNRHHQRLPSPNLKRLIAPVTRHRLRPAKASLLIRQPPPNPRGRQQTRLRPPLQTLPHHKNVQPALPPLGLHKSHRHKLQYHLLGPQGPAPRVGDEVRTAGD